MERRSIRRGVAWAHYYLGEIALAAGEVTRAGEELQAGRRECDAGIDDIYLCGYVHVGLGKWYQVQDDLASAREHLDRALAIREGHGETEALNDSRIASANLLIDEGDPKGATKLAELAAAELAEAQKLDYAALARASLASAYLVQGETAAAETALNPSREHLARTENVRVRLAAHLVDAWRLHLEGDPTASKNLLGIALVEAREHGLLGRELQARALILEIQPDATAREELINEARAAGYLQLARRLGE